MSDLLREFWVRAECEEPVFSAEEIEWAPPGQFEMLCRHGFLRETDRATWARCEACDDEHVEQVAWIRNGTTGELAPFVSCQQGGGSSVSIERLRRWAIDLDAIARTARRDLGLIGTEAVLVPGRVWFLGRRHLAGRWRDFFFVVGATREDTNTLWDRCRQIEDAPAPVVLMPSRPLAERRGVTLLLSRLAEISEAGFSLNLAYLADSLPRDGQAGAAKTISSFAVPDGATWADLRITVREHSLRAEICGSTREFSFDDLGLSGPEDRLWQLLCALARLGGQTPARSKYVSEKDAATFRKQVSDLRQLLSTVFPIDGEPIKAMRGTGSYRCVFQISLDRQDGFPVQPERWDECCFTELRDGRIAISVSTKEVFRARAFSENTTLPPDNEVAERTGIRTEEYDLRALGLADDTGTPTAAGSVLLEFLRNGGKLTRRGDDKDVLRLGERLRLWMGVDSGPFQFAPSRRLWTATFECGTAAGQ
jgi:hypothetical protein